MSARKVIVFGPTGAVGSAAAITAAELGAKVTLAMRTVDKPIPGLDGAQEKQHGYERIYADLTQSDSVRDAVQKSEAKSAFIYLAHGAPNHMRSTIEALKSGGIEFVVFLSSFTVRGELSSIAPSDLIPYVHARVEMTLEEVFGRDNFVAARPGSFATNMRQYKSGLAEGKVKIFMPDGKVDCIVPEDIGRVCGTILAKGLQDAERKIYLYGPKLLGQEEALRILAKVVGKDPHVENLRKGDEEAAHKMFVEDRGMPPPIVKYMLAQLDKNITGSNQVFGYAVDEDELMNVEKYSGKKATTFEAWAEANKGVFVS